MPIRVASEKDKKDLYTIMAYCFNSGNYAIEENLKSSRTDFDHFLVNEHNGRIDNLIEVIPFKMQFENQFVNMGGIAGVSSLPEDRGNGSIANLLTYSMEYMKEKNMIFSALAPFAMPFYRKYGYEWGFSFQLIETSIEDLKKFKCAAKYAPLTRDDNEIIENFRLNFIKNVNGPIYRDEKILNNRWDSYYNSFTHCYASYGEDQNINAISFFKIDGRMLRVSEFYYLNQTGKENMLAFFYRHRSQVDNIEITTLVDDDIRLIIPSPRVKFWQWANMMIRVVMVKEALEMMCVDKNINDSFTLKVIDEQAKWNNKIFKLELNKGKIKVSEDNVVDFEITIQRMSQLTIGFIDGNTAIKNDFVKVNNTKKIETFKNTFVHKTTMMWQSF